MHYFWSFLNRSDNESVRFGLSISEKFGRNCIVGTLLAFLTNDISDVGVSQFSHFLRYSASREQNFYISFVTREPILCSHDRVKRSSSKSYIS